MARSSSGSSGLQVIRARSDDPSGPVSESDDVVRVRHLRVQNLRGIEDSEILFKTHTLLVGGNNAGKSTICEALDLVLGTERLYRRPVVDEHDFYLGRYLDSEGTPVEIRIDVILTQLTPEERRRYGNRHLRLWDDEASEFIDEEEGGVDRSDDESVEWALPVCFIGRYDREEDDFVGDTFFCHPEPLIDADDAEALAELGAGLSRFSRPHKRLVGYVYLRALRTGSRALSLQRGSRARPARPSATDPADESAGSCRHC